MTKIHIDENNLNLNIISNMESAIDCLNSSINDIGVLQIPYEFKYSTYLKELITYNNDTKNSLVNKKNKIKTDVDEFKTIATNNINDITDIKNVNF